MQAPTDTHTSTRPQVYGKGVMLIVPTEAFVVKTKDQATGTKAFINVSPGPAIPFLLLRQAPGARTTTDGCTRCQA